MMSEVNKFNLVLGRVEAKLLVLSTDIKRGNLAQSDKISDVAHLLAENMEGLAESGRARV